MNRQTLHETMPKERADDIVFHLLIPTKRNIGFAERMAIDDGIGKLIIKGHKNNGRSQVWFNFVRTSVEVILEDVGNLNTDEEEIRKTVERSFGFGATAMICGLAGFASAIRWRREAPRLPWSAASTVVRHSLKTSSRLLGPPQARLP